MQVDIARTARVLGEALAAGVAEETLTALQESLRRAVAYLPDAWAPPRLSTR